MRGKVCFLRFLKLPHRITPAYAGKRYLSRYLCSRYWDHPRICGEKCVGYFGRQSEVGITPAYAGKSIFTISCRSRFRDHPRICGEKKSFQTHGVLRPGSPPHMRGKVFFLRFLVFLGRITPAYAGKSARIASGSWSNWDHPRICGEKRAAAPRCTGSGDHPRICGEKSKPTKALA